MNEPISLDDLGLNDTFDKIERIANLLEEVNRLAAELKEEEGIEINFELWLR